MNNRYKRIDFEKALLNLSNILHEPQSDIVRDAAIKRYEICYELAWKSIQEVLKTEGLEIFKSPKSCFKQAFKQGWIENEEVFAEMVQTRNLTAHTYNEDLAKEIFSHLGAYVMQFISLQNNLQKL
jgi:nucleotidyltransferase substrate binding protein (TIGR01987 family)